LNPNSGDTGGLLKDDWRSVDLAKEELLKTYQGRPLENQAPGVVDVAAVPPTRS
jgi:endoglucanase